MRSVLICQSDADLVQAVMPRWLDGFTELAGILVIRDKASNRWRKLKKCVARDGILATLDLLAFRLYQRAFLTKADRAFEQSVKADMLKRFPNTLSGIPILEVSSPNSPDAAEFLKLANCDIALACCKHILKPEIFEIPRHGTYVMHPGICPEYRNAHGCFWAMVNGDLSRVGMTLLKVDKGIDTGPVLGYFTGQYDEVRETPLMIQRRMTYGNLDKVAETIQAFIAGTARPIDTRGRQSAIWGQPTLTAYWKWKRSARERSSPKGPRPSDSQDLSETRGPVTATR
jgi:methionyl-tRNA formyltransferase